MNEVTVKDVDNILMSIMTEDDPKLSSGDWIIITEALEYFKETL